MELPERALLRFLFGLVLVGWIGLEHAPRLEAQRAVRARSAFPLQGVTGSLHGQAHSSADSPLTHLETFSGHVEVLVRVRGTQGTLPTGSFTIKGLPFGATILRAYVQVTSFDREPNRALAFEFAGVPFPARLADAVDPSNTPYVYHCSMYRFDVTGLILGNGVYGYRTGPHPDNFGDSLVVVYEHPDLPLRTIALHDGSESMQHATTATTFRNMPAGVGELTLFTQADESVEPGGEGVRLNSEVVAGPGEVFSALSGPVATKLSLPVTTIAGDNVVEVFTERDWFGLHLAVLSVAGVQQTITVDFEADDDGTPLVNGQDIQSGEEFGAWVRVDGASVSGLHAAIFDTTPGGANDPSQDLDLLVGLGNALVLQQQPAQSVPGIYDRPNDDANGGVAVFTFLDPATPRALDLIDIDPGIDGATVRLLDVLGRLRTFRVPAGWTEDLTQAGPPAFRRLDLTRLDPQPGFQAVATATQDAGFDAALVQEIRVTLEGSGALDNLTFSP